MNGVPAWAAQDVTLPLWAVLVLAAYSNRRILAMLGKARGSLPTGRTRSDRDDGGGSR